MRKDSNGLVFKDLHFRTSCIIDITAGIYFTSTAYYVITGIIVAKWLLVLIWYPLARLMPTNSAE